ncbi:hypothetical protein LZ32DRAFT_19646 [Colletotrichum eremochloae]|nr:hypothetical protein LZ32DRAFT_19646 [Colletotrichum eremochloae]
MVKEETLNIAMKQNLGSLSIIRGSYSYGLSPKRLGRPSSVAVVLGIGVCLGSVYITSLRPPYQATGRSQSGRLAALKLGILARTSSTADTSLFTHTIPTRVQEGSFGFSIGQTNCSIVQMLSGSVASRLWLMSFSLFSPS